MSIKQMMINSGINQWAVELLVESFLKCPLADIVYKRRLPMVFSYPVNRSDCAAWSGVKVTLMPVAKDDADIAYFTINGIDFPMPAPYHPNNGYGIGVFGRTYYFESQTVANSVKQAIIDLLDGKRGD
jgi:hypothetical protein